MLQYSKEDAALLMLIMLVCDEKRVSKYCGMEAM